MNLLDKMRPKWKHSDLETRAEFVRQLGPESAEVLAEVARTDAETKLRRLAARKLEDPALLEEIAAQEADGKLQEEMRARATALRVATACGGDVDTALAALGSLSDPKAAVQVACEAELEEIRGAALSQLTDDEALARVALEAHEADIRLAALARVTDGAALVAVAVHEQVNEVGLAAVERLEAEDDLRAVAGKAALKGVRKAAQDRLPQPETETETAPGRAGEGAAETGAAEATSAEIAGAEQTAETADDAVASPQGPEETRAEEPAAEAADSEPTPAETAEPAAAETAEPAAAEENSAETAEPAAAEPTPEELAARPWIALCRRTEALAGPGVPVALQEIGTAWAALGLPPAGHEALEARFGAAAGKAWERRHEAGAVAPEGDGEDQAGFEARLTELGEKARTLAAAESFAADARQWKDLARQWRRLTEGRELHARHAEPIVEALARFDAWREERRRQQRQRRQDNLARLTGLCNHAERMVEAKEIGLRKAERRLKEIQIALKAPGPLPAKKDWHELKRRLEAAREALTPRVRELEELEEWQRWANVPMQEELCARMEALIEEESQEAAAKGLRKILGEWKKVSKVPQSKAEELWERFKAARDKVRERVDVYYREQAKVRRANLTKKEELCVKAEAIADSTEWKGTADELKALQAEWKKVGPVPREHSDAVWKRFRAACDHFFNRRKERFDELHQEREGNLAAKETLCEKAESLADSTDWNATTEALKQLQLEWKTIGPVPRKHSDAVWKRFRAACDRFFDRRGRRDELPLEGNLEKREALCAEVEGLLPSEGSESTEAPDGLAARVEALRTAWSEAGRVPERSQAALATRFRAALEGIAGAFPQAFEGTDLDPEVREARREKLCERAEKLVEEQQKQAAEAEDEPSLEDLASQLRQALASNTIRRGATTSAVDDRAVREARRKVDRLRHGWQEIPGEPGGALEKRFREALDTLKGLLA